MGKKHYHVLLTLPGYMPDSNEIYDTIKEAEEGLKFWKNQEEDPDKVTGSYKTMYEFPNGQIAYITNACYEECEHD